MAAVALVASTTGAAAQSDELRAVEGEWVGAISFIGVGLTGNTYETAGDFAFVSAGGSLEGTFQWSTVGTQIAGAVTGPDTRPRFELTSVISNGTPIPDVRGGGEVELLVATCERLEGTGRPDPGIPVSQDVEWWALRRDATGAADPGAFFDALGTLQSEVGLTIDDLESGRVILTAAFADLEAAIADAERIGAQLDRTEGCGLEFYRSLVAAQVRRLLDVLFADSDIPAHRVSLVLGMAVRAGLLGSGAEGGNPDLEAAARTLLEQRIADASDENDATGLTYLALIAEDLGYDDLAAQAQTAMEAG